ncbi:DUF3489 domain-containing protein [Endozoicomonas arenosclerae]|uniref:DUF3489 domain-containing protein n=1 Tax=Endozoicomonas arenosclerae TaxID=1633495 RepID=UPI0007803BBD|nr:DUF3489 domain-containing protein [Endozoicomonas arenosclerae]
MKTTKLTNTQETVLKQAAETGTFHASMLALKGGARKKVLDSLTSKGFLIRLKEADTFDISPQGRAAIGLPEENKPAHKDKIRTGTKLHRVIKLLARPEGAAIHDIMKETGWQQHTVRGTLAGALKKRLGLTIESEKLEGKDRIYRITAGLDTLFAGETA